LLWSAVKRGLLQSVISTGNMPKHHGLGAAIEASEKTQESPMNKMNVAIRILCLAGSPATTTKTHIPSRARVGNTLRARRVISQTKSLFWLVAFFRFPISDVRLYEKRSRRA
jgi:hypothetical protein